MITTVRPILLKAKTTTLMVVIKIKGGGTMHKGAIKTKDGTTLLLITTTTNLYLNTTTTTTTKLTKITTTKTKTNTPSTKHHTIDNNPTNPLHLPSIKLMSLEPLWISGTRAIRLNSRP